MELYKNTPILCNVMDVPLQGAIQILRRDLESGLTHESRNPGPIIIDFPAEQALHNETYQIVISEKEVRIKAFSNLGAIYAILRISRDFLNIHPFWFWMDKLPKKRPSATAVEGTYFSEPAKIRFRGWFINDEVLLDGWKPKSKPQDFPWRMAMEAILRLGGNMVIPGTDGNSKKTAN